LPIFILPWLQSETAHEKVLLLEDPPDFHPKTSRGTFCFLNPDPDSLQLDSREIITAGKRMADAAILLGLGCKYLTPPVL